MHLRSIRLSKTAKSHYCLASSLSTTHFYKVFWLFVIMRCMLKNSFAETQVIANVSLLAKEGSVILEQDGLIAKVTIISTMFILTPLTIIKY